MNRSVLPGAAFARAGVCVALTVGWVAWASGCMRAADASSMWALVQTTGPAVAARVEVEADWLAVPVRFSTEGGSGSKSSVAGGGDEARMAADAAAGLTSPEGMVVVRDPERLELEGALRSGPVSVLGPDRGNAVLVLVPFKDATETPASASARAARWVGTWRSPGKCRADMGSPHLAVLDPEKHRASVLRAVAARVLEDKAALGDAGASMRVSGIEGPVRARLLGGRKAALFIRHAVEVSWGGK